MDAIEEYPPLPDDHAWVSTIRAARGPPGISASMKAATDPNSSIVRAALSSITITNTAGINEGYVNRYQSQEELQDTWRMIKIGESRGEKWMTGGTND